MEIGMPSTKYFELVTGELVEIPADYLAQKHFGCIDGLRSEAGDVIPLSGYLNGTVRKEHLQIIFDFYYLAQQKGVKREGPTKAPEWAYEFFGQLPKDILIETICIGSYLIATLFNDFALCYFASKLQAIKKIGEMRNFLNEPDDFAPDEFEILIRERCWRGTLLEWGVIDEATARKLNQ